LHIHKEPSRSSLLFVINSSGFSDTASTDAVYVEIRILWHLQSRNAVVLTYNELPHSGTSQGPGQRDQTSVVKTDDVTVCSLVRAAHLRDEDG
jgi:hypothetical protein